jgi:hypothetical protein
MKIDAEVYRFRILCSGVLHGLCAGGRTSKPRKTSPCASERVLPCSRVMTCATSSLYLRMRSRKANITLCRCDTGVRAHEGKASKAEPIAASNCKERNKSLSNRVCCRTVAVTWRCELLPYVRAINSCYGGVTTSEPMISNLSKAYLSRGCFWNLVDHFLRRGILDIYPSARLTVQWSSRNIELSSREKFLHT